MQAAFPTQEGGKVVFTSGLPEKSPRCLGVYGQDQCDPVDRKLIGFIWPFRIFNIFGIHKVLVF